MIVVIGSSNTDMVVKTQHLPVSGETVLGGNFFMNAGGKGANQAVAAARLNADVTFIAKVGNDIFGKTAIDLFDKEKINIDFIFRDEINSSGVALITVDEKGENFIAVASGANSFLLKPDLQKAMDVLMDAHIILAQLETPVETIEFIAEFAQKNNKIFILNPAPACQLSDELLSKISIITPNEKEAEMLTGIEMNDIESAKSAAILLHEKGIQTIIITLGEKGALLFDNEVFEIVSSIKVKAVDTTAAGDVFNGALAVALSEQKSLVEAVKFANCAAALSVTKLGAQTSAPQRNEVEIFMRTSF